MFCTTVVKPYLVLTEEIEDIKLPIVEDNSTISLKRNNIIIAVETDETNTTNTTEPV